MSVNKPYWFFLSGSIEYFGTALDLIFSPHFGRRKPHFGPWGNYPFKYRKERYLIVNILSSALG